MLPKEMLFGGPVLCRSHFVSFQSVRRTTTTRAVVVFSVVVVFAFRCVVSRSLSLAKRALLIKEILRMPRAPWTPL